MLHDPKQAARIAREVARNAPRKLSARKLGVRQEFLDAFDRVLARMERGEIVDYCVYNEYGEFVPSTSTVHAFNMDVWDTPECGTVHCVGGWCDAAMGRSGGLGAWRRRFLRPEFTSIFCREYKALDELFFPPGPRPYTYIKVEDAIAAMKMWRTTGNVDWEEIMVGDRDAY